MLADGLKPSFRHVGRRGLQGEERRRSLEPEDQDVQPWSQARRATQSNLLFFPQPFLTGLGQSLGSDLNSDCVSVSGSRKVKMKLKTYRIYCKYLS
jgi:hypothetical protein